jgi:hypothetical protein
VTSRALIGFVVLLTVAAAAAAAALASRGDPRPPAFDQLTNQGRVVPMAGLLAIDRAELQTASVVELRLLADRGGVRFYRGVTRDGHGCLILARAVDARERFGAFGCPSGFPSADEPVADLTVYTQGLDDAYPLADEVAGFAADGVGAVGVRSPGGEVRWVPVEGNVYVEHPTSVRAAELLVRDRQGRVLKSTPVGGRTLREEYGVTD